MMLSVLSFETFSMPTVSAEACSTPYIWQTVSNYGHTEWVCYKDGQKVYGWNYINGNWYYLYDNNGYMAHDTFINGYYVNSDGAWTYDIPYAVQRIIDVVPDSGWIYTSGNSYGSEPISILYNQNLKYLCRYGWNAPDVNGAVVCIDYCEFFVADDGTVFRAPHQAYDTIYQYDNYGNIVNEYPYIENYNEKSM